MNITQQRNMLTSTAITNTSENSSSLLSEQRALVNSSLWNNTSPSPTIRYPDHFDGTIDLYKVLFAIIDVFGIVGNSLVIATIILNPNMRSTIYYLLANLAFSDLLFAILAPFHISMLVDNYNWKYGETFCRVYYFIFRSFYAFSIMNLILITVERFLATRYPLSFRANPKRTVALILGTWVFSFLISAPFLSVMTYEQRTPTIAKCYQKWSSNVASRSYYTFVYTTLYFIPATLMAVMYVLISITLRKQPLGILTDKNDTQCKQYKARKRMSLLVIVIVISFFVCWSPWNIMEFVKEATDKTWRNPKHLPAIMNYSVLAAIFSTNVNPILFSFMSYEFRTGFRFVFVRISSWYLKRRRSSEDSPTGLSNGTGQTDLSRRSCKRSSHGYDGNKTEARALV